MLTSNHNLPVRVSRKIKTVISNLLHRWEVRRLKRDYYRSAIEYTMLDDHNRDKADQAMGKMLLDIYLILGIGWLVYMTVCQL